ncbi:MAG: pilus assembly protein TadG-related protein [Acetobacter sp.]|uniref:pilus assembly protein TadG-related protein n=1 Tax=Acetobacter sp. TaxID=440 RepID=UPI0039EA299B
MSGFWSFHNSRNGSVSLMAALSTSVAIIGVAAAINIGAAIQDKKTLQNIADAAALQAEKTVQAAQTNTSSTMNQSDVAALAQTTVQNYVAANTTGSTLPDIQVSYTAESTYSGNVSVTLSRKTSLFMAGFLPNSGIPVTATATATMTLGNSYIQIIFLVDISNSMGIGGTPADISALENSAAQCAFACHDPNGYRGSCTQKSSSSYGSFGLPPCNTRVTAQQAGINLKIDYVNQAIQTFMAQLVEYANKDQNHITTSITTYGTTIQQLQPSTTDLATASSVASTIDLETAVPMPVLGYTRTSDALNTIASQLTNIGQGTSENSQRTYLVFISDGAQDIKSNANSYQHIVTVDYQSACTQLKQMGVTLLSVWVPYYPIYGSQQYNTLIAPLPTTGTGSMEGAMQSCATSSDYYFEADDGPAIQNALKSSLSSIIISSGLRLIK